MRTYMYMYTMYEHVCIHYNTLVAVLVHSYTYSRTALHCAAYGGFQDCVQLLLEAGSDVTLQDSEGITALHWAASTGHMGTTSLLLASGTSVCMQYCMYMYVHE